MPLRDSPVNTFTKAAAANQMHLQVDYDSNGLDTDTIADPLSSTLLQDAEPLSPDIAAEHAGLSMDIPDHVFLGHSVSDTSSLACTPLHSSGNSDTDMDNKMGTYCGPDFYYDTACLSH